MRSVCLFGSRSISLTVDEIDRAIHELDPGGLLWVPGEWQEIVCGMAGGMDLAGKAWADAHGIPVYEDPVTKADYARWGRRGAPKVRNGRMADRCDGAIGFWTGLADSGGTADMCARMLVRDKPVRLIPWRRRRR